MSLCNRCYLTDNANEYTELFTKWLNNYFNLKIWSALLTQVNCKQNLMFN